MEHDQWCRRVQTEHRSTAIRVNSQASYLENTALDALRPRPLKGTSTSPEADVIP